MVYQVSDRHHDYIYNQGKAGIQCTPGFHFHFLYLSQEPRNVTGNSAYSSSWNDEYLEMQ